MRFWYDGKTMRLTEETEECATFYGRMLDHDYTTKECFNKNFFKDWRKVTVALSYWHDFLFSIVSSISNCLPFLDHVREGEGDHSRPEQV